MEGLQNIREIKDLNYFGWEIYPSRKNKKNLISWEDFMKRLKPDSQPRKIINIKELSQSLSADDAEKVILSDKKPTRYENITFWEYPSTVPPVIACHVASQRGCSMEEVKFLVHGSVFGILSRAKPISKSEHVMVQRLGGGNIINIRTVINSHGNLADAGHQFEKLVTGEKILSKPSLRNDQHLRLIQVGSQKVLVCAEADAIDPNTGKQVEIKSKNLLTEKAYDKDKLKILFQMLSNGSETLIAPERTMNEDKSFSVEAVKQIPIQDVVNSLSEGVPYLTRKINTIETNLQVIQETIKLEDETCYELTFDKDVLHLNPFLKEQEKNSKCKETQHHFQQLNSDYFRERLLKQDSQDQPDASTTDLPEPGKSFLNKHFVTKRSG
jgi:hypothetical protein